MQKSAWLYLLIAFLVVAGGILAVWWPTRNQTATDLSQDESQLAQPQSKTVTMTGSYECLPHRDTSGPQTLECAFGLLMGDTYFAIDTSEIGNNILTTLNTGDQITVSGQLTPVDQLDPESRLQTYDIAGVIQATTIAAVNSGLISSPTASPDMDKDELMTTPSPSPLASPTTNVPNQ